MNQEFLAKHNKLHYIGKCIKHFNDKDFIAKVLYSDKNPYEIEFVEFGKKNRDKVILVIPNVYHLNGFCAELRNTLKLLAFAERYGFVPYTYYHADYLYREDALVNGVKNPFEYYFNQTCDLSYEDVMHSANVVFAEKKHTQMIDLECGIKPHSYEMNESNINQLGEIYKKYMRINPFSMQKIGEDYEKLLGENTKILGVHHRGTDYKKIYKYHPVYVTIEEKIAEIEQVQEEYDRIFLATDDQGAVDAFRNRFGTKVCYYTDVYRGEGDTSVAFSNAERMNHKYLLGLEVLRDVYTLARCEGLIAGVSQVAFCARVMKKSIGADFFYIKIMDKGLNEKGSIFSA